MPKKPTPKTITPEYFRGALDTYSERINAAGESIRAIQSRAERASRYERVRMGLALLQARQLYLIPNDGSRGGGPNNCLTKNNALAVLQVTPQDAPESFLHYLDTFTWLPRRTAYVYIQVAENLGLTAASDPSDVDEMQTLATLDGLTSSQWQDLCKAPASEGKTTANKPTDRYFDFYSDALNSIAQSGHTITSIRESLTDSQLDTAAALHLRQLEAITGRTFRSSDDEPDPDHWRQEFANADESILNP